LLLLLLLFCLHHIAAQLQQLADLTGSSRQDHGS
jgi:hypothetical protein